MELAEHDEEGPTEEKAAKQLELLDLAHGLFLQFQVADNCCCPIINYRQDKKGF